MSIFDINTEFEGYTFGSPAVAAGHEVLVNALKRRPTTPVGVDPDVFARIVEVAPDDLETTLMTPGVDISVAVQHYGAAIPGAIEAELDIQETITKQT